VVTVLGFVMLFQLDALEYVLWLYCGVLVAAVALIGVGVVQRNRAVRLPRVTEADVHLVGVSEQFAAMVEGSFPDHSDVH
jgi:hypothetical protein